MAKGFECVIVSDATDGYVPEFKQIALEMVTFSEEHPLIYLDSSRVSHLV